MPPPQEPPAVLPPRRWWSTAGAWLAIGTSPAALVLGAGLADRSGGAVPLAGLLLGGVLMTALLVGSGYLGLAAPHGSGTRLSGLLPAYLPVAARTVVGWLLAIAMVGWLGFNVGLGGAALGSLSHLPDWAGAVVLGTVLLPIGLAGVSRWNPLAVLTTTSSLLLVMVVVLRADTDAAPVTAGLPSGSGTVVLAAIAIFVGYGSVFAVRAPDFTAGLRGRSDLAVCVGLLVVPTLSVAVAGSLLWQATGSTDLVAELERSRLGTVLVVASVVAPALTSFHSGGFALVGVTRLAERQAVVVVSLCGTLLAATGFHHQLVPWLGLLAATLPPLVVALAIEGWRRRRGRPARVVPAWTWLPASAVALALTAAGLAAAAVTGLALAALLAFASSKLGARGNEPTMTKGSVFR